MLLSLGALYLALRGVHWSEVGSALREANYPLIALAVALFIGAIGLKTMRWRLLFYPLDHIRPWYLFGSLNTAYLINNILPFQMGDVGRAYLLSELAGVSTTRSLSTVVVERVLDVLTLLLFLLCLGPFIGIPTWARAPAITLAALFSAVALLLVFAAMRRSFVIRLVDRFSRFAPAAYRPRLNQIAHNAIDAFAVLTRPRVATALVSYTVANWLCMGLMMFVGMRAFNLGTDFAAALLLVVATTFGLFVPSSPGAFGVYHAIVIGVLTSVFDVDKAAAVSFALVIHLVVYLPPIFIATGFLLKERRFWQELDVVAKFRSLREAEPLGEQAPVTD